MAGWFSLIHFGNIEIGWAAWGVGALTGLGARIFGGEGGSTLGALCALFTAIAIIGGHALGTDLTHFSPLIIVFLLLGVASAIKSVLEAIKKCQGDHGRYGANYRCCLPALAGFVSPHSMGPDAENVAARFLRYRDKARRRDFFVAMPHRFPSSLLHKPKSTDQ